MSVLKSNSNSNLSFMSYYLKYRPHSFDTLVWQRHIVDVLLAQLQWDKLNHNYLFYGPRGTGKTSTARLLAKAANDPGFVSDPNAEIIELIDTGKTLDYVEIDAASHTGVDNIREEIIEKALYTPTTLTKKVYVIDEVHMLSKGAFNALLKIMEEPPEYLMFILATTEIHRVPDTIISRCQVFNFRNHTVDDIVWQLENIAKKEDLTYEVEGLRMIAKLSQGWMRDAIKYLEQVSILWEVTPDNVAKFLWVVSSQVLDDLISLLQKKDFDWLSAKLSDLQQWGTDLLSLSNDMLVYFDDHFWDNPERYSTMATIRSEMIRDMKGSSMPLVMMKAKLFRVCQG